MEDATIAEMNLERFWCLLGSEADPAKRRTILKLIRETEAKARDPQPPRTWLPQLEPHGGDCLK